MTAIWADIDGTKTERTRKHNKRSRKSGLHYHFEELLYADDTLLFGPNTKHLQDKLHQVEKESSKYGMKLNLTKCVYLGMISASRRKPKFANGTRIPKATAATYLGVKLCASGSTEDEVHERLKQTMITWRDNEKKKSWDHLSLDVTQIATPTAARGPRTIDAA